jgi:uncharacterized protein involved in exopolysaccharide biosynthesis
MQNYPGDSESRSTNLPATSEERRVSALTVARSNPQALSTELRIDPDAAERDDEIDLLEYWRILVKRRWTVIATAAMVMIIVLVGSLMMTPIYRSVVTLQIERNGVQVVEQVGDENSYDRTDFTQTQVGLLESRGLAQRVVSQLGLLNSGEMDRLWPGSVWKKLASLAGGNRAGDAGSKEASRPAGGNVEGDELKTLTEAMQKNLSVEPVRNSQLLKLNYDSPSPAFSQRAANAYAEAFIASNLERRLDSTSYAKSYLEDRLQELRLKLEDSERKLVAFAQKEQIVNSGDDSGASLSQQNLGSLNAAYAKAKEDRIRAEARWRQASSLRGSGLQTSAGEDSMITSLQDSKGKLMVDYQDKLRLYKPD